MPTTLSDKRKAEIFEAVSNELGKLRLLLNNNGLTRSNDLIDHHIALSTRKVADAAIAAAEGRERP